MSPPDTNLQKQKSRHRPALIGIALAAIVAAVIFFLNAYTAVDEDANFTDDGPQAPLDGSTGN